MYSIHTKWLEETKGIDSLLFDASSNDQIREEYKLYILTNRRLTIFNPQSVSTLE